VLGPRRGGTGQELPSRLMQAFLSLHTAYGSLFTVSYVIRLLSMLLDGGLSPACTGTDGGGGRARGV
jgi:hypothetical protein